MSCSCFSWGLGLHGQAVADSALFHDLDSGYEEELDDAEGDGYYQLGTATKRYLHRQYMASVERLRFQDSVRYGYFMEEVYGPALRDPALPAENRRFLVQLKRYLECPTDSCGHGDRLLRAVYLRSVDTVAMRQVIVDDFPPDDDNVHGIHHGWRDDMPLSKWEKERLYRIVYANAPVVRYARISRFRFLPGSCKTYKSYELRQVAYRDTLIPAFCSTFDLQLEWETDPKSDSLLRVDRTHQDNLKPRCDSEDDMIAFARLKGVPGLWFARDSSPSHDWPYPTRGLMMDYKGEMAVWLWRQQIEMVGCSCL